MNDRADGALASGERTAGAMLRQARQAQGVHIAALAAAIKVSQKKLEALESDRLDELPDATFTRALAQAICRSLKIDAAPVLALLPTLQHGDRLEHVSEGTKQPFRERPGQHETTEWTDVVQSPAVWVPVLVLVAAAVIWVAPAQWWERLQMSGVSQPADPAPASSATPASGSTSTTTIVIEPPADAASAVVQPASAPVSGAIVAESVAAMVAMPASASAATGAALLLRASADSWVEVQDARSRTLVSRTMKSGEQLAVDGEAPLRVKVGNARGTEVSFRGQPVDLASRAQGNVARFELK